MAYAVIQFVEAGQRLATLCRLDHGQPTGADGVMDALSAFIEETSPQMLREGSPGAVYMAQLFMARDAEAGRSIRLLGGEGPLGLSLKAYEAMEGQGYFYEVHFPRLGERSQPQILQRPIPSAE